MTAFEMEMPENFETDSNFLQEPGIYHFIVLAVDEQPTGKNGQMLDGFRVAAAVLDGTVAGQRDRQIELMFFNPKMSDKNAGEFAKRKQARFALATMIIPQPTPGERVTVNLQDAVGRQFVAEIDRQTDQSGQPMKFLQLAWANVYHVDDPAVAQVPKCKDALALLPAALRRKPESFQTASQRRNGGDGRKQGTPAMAAAPAVNVDDL